MNNKEEDISSDEWEDIFENYSKLHYLDVEQVRYWFIPFKNWIETQYESPAKLQKQIIELKAEIEAKDKILDDILVNPYPIDIFGELTSEELKNIHELLKIELNIPLDKLSAHIGREFRKPYQQEIERLKKNL